MDHIRAACPTKTQLDLVYEVLDLLQRHLLALRLEDLRKLLGVDAAAP
jgi:hypothetical protein